MATGSQDSANARVAVAGAWYVAPVGTAAPTTASSALPAAYRNVGYLSEDGSVRGTDRSAENLRGWPGNVLLRSVVTESSLTYKFTLVETTRTTIELSTGAVIDATGQYDVNPASTGGRRAFVFDILDGEKVERRYIPEGEVTEVGETTFAGSELTAYEITVTAYASLAIGGKAERVFNPQLAVPVWVATTAKVVGNQVSLSGGAVLEATVAGTTGGTSPTPPAVGATVVDGTVTWVRLS